MWVRYSTVVINGGKLLVTVQLSHFFMPVAGHICTMRYRHDTVINESLQAIVRKSLRIFLERVKITAKLIYFN